MFSFWLVEHYRFVRNFKEIMLNDHRHLQIGVILFTPLALANGIAKIMFKQVPNHSPCLP